MVIRSRQNRRLKDMRRLRRCKGDRALLEGPHLLREAVAAGLVPDPVLATPEFLDSATGRLLVEILPVRPLEVLPALLDELADTDSPRGVLGAVRLERSGVAALPRSAEGIYVYVDGLQDPGNLGALARVAEASGVAALVLAEGTVSPNHPRALRASAGSLLRLPVAVRAAPEALDRHLGSPPATWCALVAGGGSDLYSTRLPRPLVLALGAEGPGLSAALRRHAGVELAIPMRGPVESLNATVAAAVVLFEWLRRGPDPSRRRDASGPAAKSN